MKILQINKFYYLMGGVEHVFFDTVRLLKDRGNDVMLFSMHDSRNIPSDYEQYFVSNIDYEKKGIKNKIGASLRLLYYFEAKKNIESLIRREKPDVAHIHNIYHQISPSILHSLKKFNIPVVMTLHDYKLVCSSYALLAHRRICEACKEGRYYNCLLNKCVKNSYLKSLLGTIEMYLHHNILSIYDLVDLFIAPSQFLKNKIKEMGFKGEVVYLPNFVKVKDYKPCYEWRENSFVYFGRLSREKGLFTLLDAAKNIDGVNLKIIGDGPLREKLEKKIRIENINNVNMLGHKNGEDLKEEICKSLFVVLPSGGYENNPRSLIEAFCLGKPAIGSRIGGIPELVIDNVTGLTFEPGDSADLSEKIVRLLNNRSEIIRMGKKAREFAEKEFDEDLHYERLIGVHKKAINKNSVR